MTNCNSCGGCESGFYGKNRVCVKCYNTKTHERRTQYAKDKGFKTYYEYLKHKKYERSN